MGTWKASDLREGAYKLIVTVTDLAGNSATREHVFFVDLTPPDITLTSQPPPAITYSYGYLLVRLTASELIEGQVLIEEEVKTKNLLILDLALDRDYSNGNGSFHYKASEYSKFPHGQVLTGVVQVKDMAGNPGQPEAFGSRVDLLPPVMTVENVTLTECRFKLSKSELKWPTAKDDYGMNRTEHSGFLFDKDYRYKFFMGRQDYCGPALEWTAVDMAGNRITKKQYYKIDIPLELIPIRYENRFDSRVRDWTQFRADTLRFKCDPGQPRNGLDKIDGSARAYSLCRCTGTTVEDSQCFDNGFKEFPVTFKDEIDDSDNPPCPGKFLRTYTATNPCTGKSQTAVQTIEITEIDRTPPTIQVSNMTVTECYFDFQRDIIPPRISDNQEVDPTKMTFKDRFSQCKLERTWIAYDTSENVASQVQTIQFQPDFEIRHLPEIRQVCGHENSTPLSSAIAKASCLDKLVAVTLALKEPKQHPACPGVFSKTFEAKNLCTGQTKEVNQTITLIERCQKSRCGGGGSVRRGSGSCVLGECACISPWHGSDCGEEVGLPMTPDLPAVFHLKEGQNFIFELKVTQGDDGPLSWILDSGPKGLKIHGADGNMSWPSVAAGLHQVSLEVYNSAGSKRDIFVLNVLPAYTATLDTVSPDLYPSSAQPIMLTGIVNRSSEDAKAVPVTIWISQDGIVSEFVTHSNRKGRFTLEYHMLPEQYGHFQALASHPLNRLDEDEDPEWQTEWDIMGMKVTPATIHIKEETIQSFSKEYESLLRIVNDGTVVLADLQVSIPNRPKVIGLEVSVAFVQGKAHSSVLDVGSELEVSMTVKCPGPSRVDFDIVIEAAQGVKRSVPIELEVAQVLPQFDVTRSPRALRCAKGDQLLLFYEVTNIGRAPVSGLRLELPSTSLLSLVSFPSTGLIDGGKSIPITLKATIPVKYDKDTFSGEFRLISKETSKLIEFHIEVHPFSGVDFRVVVKDESAYSANSRHPLMGATVQLRSPVDSVDESNVKTLKSDKTGSVLFENIAEGFYDLHVSSGGAHEEVGRVVHVIRAAQSEPELVFLKTIPSRKSYR